MSKYKYLPKLYHTVRMFENFEYADICTIPIYMHRAFFRKSHVYAFLYKIQMLCTFMVLKMLVYNYSISFFGIKLIILIVSK